jgi:putative drug exporter of the RND superfamily
MRRWGAFVHRRRWLVLLASLLCLAASGTAIVAGGQLKNSANYDVESVHAADLMSAQLPSVKGTTFGLVLGSRNLSYASPVFEHAVDTALAPLRGDSRVAHIETPYNSGGQAARSLISADRRSVLALVALHIDFDSSRQQFASLRNEVRSTTLSVTAAGDPAIAYDFDSLLAKDLQRSETVSLPLALILLVIVFATGIAALLCLGVGVFAVAGGLGGTLLLTHAMDVSTYAENVVTLIGLGVAIDYSLFVVNRFREELGQGADVSAALGTTMATAGRAIAFSGLTVAIGLGGLLFYTGTFLVSMGIAGAMVVAVSVLYALTFLPALLAILGPRVNRLRVPILQPRPFGKGAWHRLATWVMRRPWLVLLPTLAILLTAGTPFLGLHLANRDVTQLPPNAEARRGAELLQNEFPSSGQNSIPVVLRFASGPPSNAANVAAAYTLSRRLAAIAGVVGVRSYVDVVPGATLATYQRLYQQPPGTLPAAVRDELRTGTGSSIAVLTLDSHYLPSSDEAHQLVRTVRAQDAVAGATTQVTGDTAFDIDLVSFMVGHTPAAVAFVVVTTFVVLMLLLRSLVLPLKAVIMNALSLSAAFGALVWIFQQGHFASVLGFTPEPLDPTIPVLLFCIIFGLSMDYEVFLLTRMQESYRSHGDNRRAVAEGLERSGRLVTGAAAIMASVFIAFALASVVTIKSLGLGMAVAVIADATLVRALVVPALMRLLGSANWWAPRWLRRTARAPRPAKAAA